MRYRAVVIGVSAGAGGLAVVQDPETAQAVAMPRAALAATPVDHIVALAGIAPLLLRISAPKEAYGTTV